MRSRIRWRLVLAALICGLPGSAATSLRAAERPPNVLLILIDDMGWGDLSCFGGTAVETQHLDRLAAEGLRFAQFYVAAPICSPSRLALTTGQYPPRWRITSYLSNRAENERRGMAQWLDTAAPSLARRLHAAGYATGHFGKWHLGGQRDVGEAPLITEYGFEESLTNFEGLGPRVLPLCDAYDGQPPRRHALGSDNLGRGPIVWQDRSRVTETFVGAALAFVRKAASDGRPFYVNLWPDDVHSPFFPPESRRGDGAKRQLYHAVLDTMDEQLGVLLEAIREDERLRNNTLVLVCSDNGPEPGAGSAGVLRGAKGSLYEGGIRSPLIAWGPGLVSAERVGQVNERSFVCALDIPPSVLSLAGVTADGADTMDGEDVSETLLGRSDRSRSGPVYWRRPPDRKFPGGRNQPPQRDLAMRDGDWKLLCEYDGSLPELYNLRADPGEQHNVAGERADVVRRMTEAVVRWHAALPADLGASYEPAGN